MLSVALNEIPDPKGGTNKKFELRWDFYDASGTKRSRRKVFHGTLKQANDEKRMIELKINSTDAAPMFESQHTLMSWLEWWIQNGFTDAKSPETIENYQDQIDDIALYPIARMPLKKLTPLACLDWWNAYKLRPNGHDPSRSISLGTAIQAWSVLNNSLNRAVQLDQIATNPMRKAFPKRPKVVKVNESEALTEEEYIAYSKAADTDIIAGALIHLALDTGLRREDAAGLKWSKVDLEHRIITVKMVLVETKQGGRVMKEPKTDNAVRDLSISRKTAQALRLHKERQKMEASKRANWEDHDLVWPRRDGKPATPHALYQKLKGFQKRHKLADKYCLHELRHTMITNQLEDGVDPASVAERAGHGVRMTLTVYAHMKGRRKQREMADLHDRLTASGNGDASVV